MTRGSINYWKYSTIGLAAAFVLGLSMPREVAARVKPVADVLLEILANTDLITAKTNTLPADPASQSALDTQLVSILSDTSDIKDALATPPTGSNGAKAVLTQSMGIDPPDGVTQKVQVIAPEPGKVFYGHINGSLAFPAGTTGTFTCVEAPGFGSDLSSMPSGLNFRAVNSDFVCTELYITVSDSANGVDAPGGNVIAATVYFQTMDVTP